MAYDVSDQGVVVVASQLTGAAQEIVGLMERHTLRPSDLAVVLEAIRCLDIARTFLTESVTQRAQARVGAP